MWNLLGSELRLLQHLPDLTPAPHPRPLSFLCTIPFDFAVPPLGLACPSPHVPVPRQWHLNDHHMILWHFEHKISNRRTLIQKIGHTSDRGARKLQALVK